MSVAVPSAKQIRREYRKDHERILAMTNEIYDYGINAKIQKSINRDPKTGKFVKKVK